LILGSVAEGVIRRNELPVLLLTPRMLAQRSEHGTTGEHAGVVAPLSIGAHANGPPGGNVQTTTLTRIPESIRAEHEAIHEELVRATKAAGAVGEAARELASILHPHFVREEQIALPPLGLLAPLARGEFTSEMSGVLPMTDSLRTELPRMLEEHKAIRAATIRLGDVARAEGNTAVAHLAEQLNLHAQSEEELFYPAAILVGDLVRARAR
jgi:hypothetical protein